MSKPNEDLPLPIPTSYDEYEVWLAFAKTDKFGSPAIVQALRNVKAPFVREDPNNTSFVLALLENEPLQDRNEILELFDLMDKKIYQYRVEGTTFIGAASFMMSCLFNAKWEWVNSMIQHLPDVAIPTLLKHSSMNMAWLKDSSTTTEHRQTVWDYLCREARKIQQGRTAKHYEWHEISKTQAIQKMLVTHPELVETTREPDQANLLRLFTKMPGFRSSDTQTAVAATSILLSKRNRDDLTAMAKKSQRGVVKVDIHPAKPNPKM